MRRDIDLEAAACVEGHDMQQVFMGRVTRGPLRGLPVRQFLCGHGCGRTRTDSLTWDGEVVSRAYDGGDNYLENARKLDEDMHLRRRAYRKAVVAELRRQPMEYYDRLAREAEEEAFRDHEESRQPGAA